MPAPHNIAPPGRATVKKSQNLPPKTCGGGKRSDASRAHNKIIQPIIGSKRRNLQFFALKNA